MNPYNVISEFYRPGSGLYRTLVRHGEQVAAKAVTVARGLADQRPDTAFIEAAALLHDIGIFMTWAPGIGCRGIHPYVCHGVLGRELLEHKGLFRHAGVCERHVGVGITVDDIIRQFLPLPRRDMRPITLEEQIIAYADKFYSKGNAAEKPMTTILGDLARFGAEKTAIFCSWAVRFEGYDPADLEAMLPIGPSRDS